MPGARRTRGLVCKCVQKGAHEHTGVAQVSVIPGEVALGLISCFPRSGPGSLSPSPANRFPSLTPASGRQDHTTSPHAYVTGNPWRILVGKNRSAVPNPKMNLVFDIGGKK